MAKNERYIQRSVRLQSTEILAGSGIKWGRGINRRTPVRSRSSRDFAVGYIEFDLPGSSGAPEDVSCIKSRFQLQATWGCGICTFPRQCSSGRRAGQDLIRRLLDRLRASTEIVQILCLEKETTAVEVPSSGCIRVLAGRRFRIRDECPGVRLQSCCDRCWRYRQSGRILR